MTPLMLSKNLRRHAGNSSVVLAVGVALATCLVSIGAALPGAISGHPSAATFPNDDKTIVHVLNRIGFGPRAGDPGDVAKVKAIGLQRYIDEQLHPERIPDAAMTARLAGLTTLGMSSREIAETYEIPQLEARRQKKQESVRDTKTGAPMTADDTDKQPQMRDPLQQKANRVIVELGEQKMLRAVYSERQ